MFRLPTTTTMMMMTPQVYERAVGVDVLVEGGVRDVSVPVGSGRDHSLVHAQAVE